MKDIIEIRECTTLDELAECVELQREVFALPEVELSPVRHFVVTKNAGGFTLGAYDGDRLAGYVLSVPAFLSGEKAFYSHMTGVRAEYQSRGIGSRLKWSQRDRALKLGVRYIKWTFEPAKAKNAHFNLEKLGAIVGEYQRNFYGIDYSTAGEPDRQIGLTSDRLFARWDLESEKVKALAAGTPYRENREASAEIIIPNDWSSLVQNDAETAHSEQLRIRAEFEKAFSAGMIGRGFRRDTEHPAYLLYSD
jgi:predicted GNAT superfamily acetyltransferase